LIKLVQNQLCIAVLVKFPCASSKVATYLGLKEKKVKCALYPGGPLAPLYPIHSSFFFFLLVSYLIS